MQIARTVFFAQSTALPHATIGNLAAAHRHAITALFKVPP